MLPTRHIPAPPSASSGPAPTPVTTVPLPDGPHDGVMLATVADPATYLNRAPPPSEKSAPLLLTSTVTFCVPPVRPSAAGSTHTTDVLDSHLATACRPMPTRQVSAPVLEKCLPVTVTLCPTIADPIIGRIPCTPAAAPYT